MGAFLSNGFPTRRRGGWCHDRKAACAMVYYTGGMSDIYTMRHLKPYLSYWGRYPWGVASVISMFLLRETTASHSFMEIKAAWMYGIWLR